ncbi:hypothetical protein C1646_692876 [Rhizophagus diaphanus]|nr:hypothetical protein C1646_692876 [Rhizophagus diaphanus] [Rhizophagus sp. MUCL 43196]
MIFNSKIKVYFCLSFSTYILIQRSIIYYSNSLINRTVPRSFLYFLPTSACNKIEEYI